MRCIRLALLVGTSVGCGPAREPEAVTRDSAGVAIVESSAPVDGPRPRYSIDSIPLVEIGGTGDPHQELGQQVVPTELSDGRIVVANPSSSEIRLFDAGGKWLKSIGRKGGGPGEFESLGFVARFAGDSLVAYDWSLQRYSVFGDTGGFARTGQLGGAGVGFPIPVGALGDGALVIRSGLPIGPREESGEHRVATPLFRARLDGSPPDSITMMSGTEVIARVSRTSVSVSRIIFGKAAVVAAVDSLIVLGDNEGFELGVWRPTGELVRRFRRPFVAQPVTAADVEAYIEDQLANVPSQFREASERQARETPHRSTKPAYDRVVMSAAGEIWVRHFLTSAPSNGIRAGRYSLRPANGYVTSRWPPDLSPSRSPRTTFSGRGPTRTARCLSGCTRSEQPAGAGSGDHDPEMRQNGYAGG